MTRCSGTNVEVCSGGLWRSANCTYGCSSGRCNPAPTGAALALRTNTPRPLSTRTPTPRPTTVSGGYDSLSLIINPDASPNRPGFNCLANPGVCPAGVEISGFYRAPNGQFYPINQNQGGPTSNDLQYIQQNIARANTSPTPGLSLNQTIGFTSGNPFSGSIGINTSPYASPRGIAVNNQTGTTFGTTRPVPTGRPPRGTPVSTPSNISLSQIVGNTVGNIFSGTALQNLSNQINNVLSNSPTTSVQSRTPSPRPRTATTVTTAAGSISLNQAIGNTSGSNPFANSAANSQLTQIINERIAVNQEIARLNEAAALAAAQTTASQYSCRSGYILRQNEFGANYCQEDPALLNTQEWRVRCDEDGCQKCTTGFFAVCYRLETVEAIAPTAPIAVANRKPLGQSCSSGSECNSGSCASSWIESNGSRSVSIRGNVCTYSTGEQTAFVNAAVQRETDTVRFTAAGLAIPVVANAIPTLATNAYVYYGQALTGTLPAAGQATLNLVSNIVPLATVGYMSYGAGDCAFGYAGGAACQTAGELALTGYTSDPAGFTQMFRQVGQIPSLTSNTIAAVRNLRNTANVADDLSLEAGYLYNMDGTVSNIRPSSNVIDLSFVDDGASAVGNTVPALNSGINNSISTGLSPALQFSGGTQLLNSSVLPALSQTSASLLPTQLAIANVITNNLTNSVVTTGINTLTQTQVRNATNTIINSGGTSVFTAGSNVTSGGSNQIVIPSTGNSGLSYTPPTFTDPANQLPVLTNTTSIITTPTQSTSITQPIVNAVSQVATNIGTTINNLTGTTIFPVTPVAIPVNPVAPIAQVPPTVVPPQAPTNPNVTVIPNAQTNITINPTAGTVTHNPLTPQQYFGNHVNVTNTDYEEFITETVTNPIRFYEQYGGQAGIPRLIRKTPEGGFELEYVPGIPLRDFQGTLTPQEVDAGLARLRQQQNVSGLAHGDIHDENILVNTLPDGTHEINFIDFTGNPINSGARSQELYIRMARTELTRFLPPATVPNPAPAPSESIIDTYVLNPIRTLFKPQPLTAPTLNLPVTGNANPIAITLNNVVTGVDNTINSIAEIGQNLGIPILGNSQLAIAPSNITIPAPSSSIINSSLPPIQPGEIFDPNPFNVLSLPKSQQPQALADFKIKLEYQQKGIEEIKQAIESAFNSPGYSFNTTYDIVENLSIKYGLTPEQKNIVIQTISRFDDQRNIVQKIFEKYPDQKELFKAMFGAYPVGPVEISQGPITIRITTHDPRDYAYIRNGDYANPNNLPATTAPVENYHVAAYLKSPTLIPSTENLIVFENAGSSVHTPSAIAGLPSPSILHEEQHAVNAILKEVGVFNTPQNNLTFEQINLHTSTNNIAALREDVTQSITSNKTWADGEIKDEILARIRQGEQTNSISAELKYSQRTGGSYNFYYQADGLSQVDIIFYPENLKDEALTRINNSFSNRAFSQTVDSSIDNINQMLAKGYTPQEISRELSTVDLAGWKPHIDRLPVKGDPIIIPDDPFMANLQEIVDRVLGRTPVQSPSITGNAEALQQEQSLLDWVRNLIKPNPPAATTALPLSNPLAINDIKIADDLLRDLRNTPSLSVSVPTINRPTEIQVMENVGPASPIRTLWSGSSSATNYAPLLPGQIGPASESTDLLIVVKDLNVRSSNAANILNALEGSAVNRGIDTVVATNITDNAVLDFYRGRGYELPSGWNTGSSLTPPVMVKRLDLTNAAPSTTVRGQLGGETADDIAASIVAQDRTDTIELGKLPDESVEDWIARLNRTYSDRALTAGTSITQQNPLDIVIPVNPVVITPEGALPGPLQIVGNTATDIAGNVTELVDNVLLGWYTPRHLKAPVNLQPEPVIPQPRLSRVPLDTSFESGTKTYPIIQNDQRILDEIIIKPGDEIVTSAPRVNSSWTHLPIDGQYIVFKTPTGEYLHGQANIYYLQSNSLYEQTFLRKLPPEGITINTSQFVDIYHLNPVTGDLYKLGTVSQPKNVQMTINRDPDQVFYDPTGDLATTGVTTYLQSPSQVRISGIIDYQPLPSLPELVDDPIQALGIAILNSQGSYNPFTATIIRQYDAAREIIRAYESGAIPLAASEEVITLPLSPSELPKPGDGMNRYQSDTKLPTLTGNNGAPTAIARALTPVVDAYEAFADTVSRILSRPLPPSQEVNTYEGIFSFFNRSGNSNNLSGRVKINISGNKVTRNPFTEAEFENADPFMRKAYDFNYQKYLQEEIEVQKRFYQQNGGIEGIPAFYGTTPQGGFITEYVPGKDVYNFTGRLTQNDIEKAISTLERQFARTGWPHGDINPSNIRINQTRSGAQIRFIDYDTQPGNYRSQYQHEQDKENLRRILGQYTGSNTQTYRSTSNLPSLPPGDEKPTALAKILRPVVDVYEKFANGVSRIFSTDLPTSAVIEDLTIPRRNDYPPIAKPESKKSIVTLDETAGVVTKSPVKEEELDPGLLATYENEYIQYRYEEFTGPADFYENFGGTLDIPKLISRNPDGGYSVELKPGVPLTQFDGTLSADEIAKAIKKLKNIQEYIGRAHGDLGGSYASNEGNIIIETLPDGSHDIHFIDFRGITLTSPDEEIERLYNTLLPFTPANRELQKSPDSYIPQGFRSVTDFPTLKPKTYYPRGNETVSGMEVQRLADGSYQIKTNLNYSTVFIDGNKFVPLIPGKPVPGLAGTTVLEDNKGNLYYYDGSLPKKGDLVLLTGNSNPPNFIDRTISPLFDKRAYERALDKVISGAIPVPNDFPATAITLINEGYNPKNIDIRVLTDFSGDLWDAKPQVGGTIPKSDSGGLPSDISLRRIGPESSQDFDPIKDYTQITGSATEPTTDIIPLKKPFIQKFEEAVQNIKDILTGGISGGAPPYPIDIDATQPAPIELDKRWDIQYKNSDIPQITESPLHIPEDNAQKVLDYYLQNYAPRDPRFSKHDGGLETTGYEFVLDGQKYMVKAISISPDRYIRSTLRGDQLAATHNVSIAPTTFVRGADGKIYAVQKYIDGPTSMFLNDNLRAAIEILKNNGVGLADIRANIVFSKEHGPTIIDTSGLFDINLKKIAVATNPKTAIIYKNWFSLEEAKSYALSIGITPTNSTLVSANEALVYAGTSLAGPAGLTAVNAIGLTNTTGIVQNIINEIQKLLPNIGIGGSAPPYPVDDVLTIPQTFVESPITPAKVFSPDSTTSLSNTPIDSDAVTDLRKWWNEKGLDENVLNRILANLEYIDKNSFTSAISQMASDIDRFSESGNVVIFYPGSTSPGTTKSGDFILQNIKPHLKNSQNIRFVNIEDLDEASKVAIEANSGKISKLGYIDDWTLTGDQFLVNFSKRAGMGEALSKVPQKEAFFVASSSYAKAEIARRNVEEGLSWNISNYINTKTAGDVISVTDLTYLRDNFPEGAGWNGWFGSDLTISFWKNPDNLPKILTGKDNFLQNLGLNPVINPTSYPSMVQPPLQVRIELSRESIDRYADETINAIEEVYPPGDYCRMRPKILSGNSSDVSGKCGYGGSVEVAEKLSAKINTQVYSATSNHEDTSGHAYLADPVTDIIIDPTAGQFIPPESRVGFETYFRGNMFIGPRETLREVALKGVTNTRTQNDPALSFQRIWGDESKMFKPENVILTPTGNPQNAAEGFIEKYIRSPDGKWFPTLVLPAPPLTAGMQRFESTVNFPSLISNQESGNVIFNNVDLNMVTPAKGFLLNDGRIILSSTLDHSTIRRQFNIAYKADVAEFNGGIISVSVGNVDELAPLIAQKLIDASANPNNMFELTGNFRGLGMGRYPFKPIGDIAKGLNPNEFSTAPLVRTYAINVPGVEGDEIKIGPGIRVSTDSDGQMLITNINMSDQTIDFKFEAGGQKQITFEEFADLARSDGFRIARLPLEPVGLTIGGVYSVPGLITQDKAFAAIISTEGKVYLSTVTLSHTAIQDTALLTDREIQLKIQYIPQSKEIILAGSAEGIAKGINSLLAAQVPNSQKIRMIAGTVPNTVELESDLETAPGLIKRFQKDQVFVHSPDRIPGENFEKQLAASGFNVTNTKVEWNPRVVEGVLNIGQGSPLPRQIADSITFAYNCGFKFQAISCNTAQLPELLQLVTPLLPQTVRENITLLTTFDAIKSAYVGKTPPLIIGTTPTATSLGKSGEFRTLISDNLPGVQEKVQRLIWTEKVAQGSVIPTAPADIQSIDPETANIQAQRLAEEITAELKSLGYKEVVVACTDITPLCAISDDSIKYIDAATFIKPIPKINLDTTSKYDLRLSSVSFFLTQTPLNFSRFIPKLI